MIITVAGGRAGAHQAAAEHLVTIVVDALRASATTASLLHYGVKRIVVVEDTRQALGEAPSYPGCLTLGERGGVKVAGFDLGNSPLQAPLPRPAETVIFTSSNMSRCCVTAAEGAPAVFLGSTVTCQAAAALAYRAAVERNSGLMLVPAGAAVDETKLVLEDYVACGALIQALLGLSEQRAQVAGDAARAAVDLHAAAVGRGLEQTFLATDNGQDLSRLGFAADVRFASHLDVFGVVPQVTRTYKLSGGGMAAVLSPA